MQRYPRVTIITPTYNRANFLPETIDSILNQGYPNLEYFVIDDGSTDNTAEVMKRYGDRVQYLYHPNVGEPSSVNRGWDLATGDYVCVVSSDDPQLPMLISRSVEVMGRNPDMIVTYPDWLLIDEQSKVLGEFRAPDYDYKLMVAELRCLPGPGAFIRRAVVQKYMKQLRDPDYPLISDLVCWWRIGLVGPFMHIPEFLGQWRQHPNMTTALVAKSRAMAETHIKLAREFFRRNDLPLRVRAWERASKCSVYVAASGFTNEADPWYSLRNVLIACWYAPKTALPHIRGALAHFPLLRKAYRAIQRR